MNVKAIKPGLRVTIDTLRSPPEILATEESLKNRRFGEGTIEKPVEDHPNAWWVRHTDKTMAPYWFDEFEPSLLPPPPNPFTAKPFPD